MNERVDQHQAQPEDTLKLLHPIFVGALTLFLGLWALVGYLTFF